jgi:hypothetical protein
MTYSCRSLLLVLAIYLTAVAAFGQDARRPQTPAPPAMPPLVQRAYIKASNADAYDYFADGGANQGHTGNSIAINRDGTTMIVGAPYESSAASGVNGDQSDNSAYASGAAYVFVRQGDRWTQQAFLKASTPTAGSHFGSSVAITRDGNMVAVAAYWESSSATGIDGNEKDDSIPQAGAVYIFERDGTVWRQHAYIKASNTGNAGADGEPGDGDQFGFSVALSGDGSTLAVGAIAEDGGSRGVNGNQSDDSKQSSGAVYVFTHRGTTWAQQAYLKSHNSDPGDLFGYAVALDMDGDTLVASGFDERGGARTINGPDDNTMGGAGALYVFVRYNGTWAQQAYIKGSRTEASDQLGYAVEISDDGNTIAAGAGDEDCLTSGINPPGCDNDSPPRGGANLWVGAAYVFVRTGGVWNEQAFIKANNARPYSSFGVKLALSGDGNALAVASYLQDDAGQGVKGPALSQFLIVDNIDPWRAGVNRADEAGAVYFYTRSGTTWTQRHYIKGSNTKAGDEFGSAVALSGDGSIMAVGAHNEDGGSRGIDGDQTSTSAEDSGAVYVFTY